MVAFFVQLIFFVSEVGPEFSRVHSLLLKYTEVRKKC